MGVEMALTLDMPFCLSYIDEGYETAVESIRDAYIARGWPKAPAGAAVDIHVTAYPAARKTVHGVSMPVVEALTGFAFEWASDVRRLVVSKLDGGESMQPHTRIWIDWEGLDEG